MKNSNHLARIGSAIISLTAVFAVPTAGAATITKATTGTDLTAGASWVGGSAPGAGDVAAWSGSSLGAGLTLGSSQSWQGISVAAAASNIGVTGAGILTLGNSGIDLSAAANHLTFSSGLTLGAGSQLWNVASAGRTLTVNGTFTRSAGAVLFVTTNATGGIGTVVFNPPLANGLVGSWAAMTNSGAAANNSASGFTYATTNGSGLAAYLGATALTGGFTWTAPGAGTANYDVSGVNQIGGTRTANTIRYTGAANIEYIANNTTTFFTNNGILNAGSGLYTIASGDVTGTGGNPATSHGKLVIGANNELVVVAANAGVTLSLPIINGPSAGSLTLVGPNTVRLDGTNTYSGGTMLDSGNLDIGSTFPLGTGGFTINSGSITPRLAFRTITNSVIVKGDFALGTAGFNNQITLSGPMDLNGATRNLNVPDTSITPDAILAGVIANGGFTKSGTGQLVLSNANTYTGPTTISAGLLEVDGNQSSANGAVTVSSNATLRGTGTIGGATTVNAGATLIPGTTAGVGTLTFGSNLTLAGETNTFRLSTSAASGNDQFVVGGSLTLDSTDTIHISAISGASPLDTTANYVLFNVATGTTMSTTPALVWDGTPPSNYNSFQLLKVGNNVVLYFNPNIPPTVVATATPAAVIHYQTTAISATVTAGSGTITNVSVNLTPISGSATASLIQDNSQLPALVYTNTFTVAGNAPTAITNLTVTAQDTTPLFGTAQIPFTVAVQNYVWDGGSALDNKWSSGTNWVGDLQPGTVGDSMTFAGTTRLTPNLDGNYNVTGVTFDNTAGSFNLTNSANTLTLSTGNGVVNNSANPQTFNVPITLAAAQTFNAAAGDLILAASVGGGGGLAKTGTGTLTLTASNGFTGSLFGNAGTVILDSGKINTGGNFCSIGVNTGDNATFTLKNTGTFTNTGDFNVGDLGDAIGTLNIQNSAALTMNTFFIGSANAAGSTASGTVNQTGGTVLEVSSGIGTFAIGGRTSATGVGTYNISGGTLTANAGIRVGGTGTGTLNVSGSAVVQAIGGINIARIAGSTGTLNLDGGTVTTLNIVSSTSVNGTNNFNGGTVKPTGNTTGFMSPAVTQINVRNGGAILDTAGFNLTIAPALQHSVITGDNATDGGLTKKGLGTLILSGANGYTGLTTVSNGTLQVDGSIASTAMVKSGATLSGNGTIGGTVTNEAGGTINPGNGVGQLTITGNLTLKTGSTNTFDVNGSTPTNDVVALGANVTYGGVLNLATNGTFTAGQQFQLFSGAGATNASQFASIAGNPGGGNAFAFTNGVLSVVSGVNTAPTNLTASVSGNTLTLSWPADHTGWKLQAQTNSLANGLGPNWVTIPGTETSNTYNATINAANGTVFYRMVYP